MGFDSLKYLMILKRIKKIYLVFLLIIFIYYYRYGFTSIPIRRLLKLSTPSYHIVNLRYQQFQEIPTSIVGKESLGENIYFYHSNGAVIHTNQEFVGSESDAATRKIVPMEKKFINKMLSNSSLILAKELKISSSEVDCSDIRFRSIPSAGIESEVFCKIESLKRVERLHFFHPLSDPQLISQSSATFTEKPNKENITNINIVIPLKGRLKILETYLENIHNCMDEWRVAEFGITIGLTVVYFDDKYAEAAKHALYSFAAKHKNIVADFILVKAKFNRSIGLKTGLKETRIQSKIIFMCDVDFMFDFTFLHRCLTTPILGKQFYLPIVFSLYNPKFTNRTLSLKEKDTRTKEDGFWRITGYGLVCGFKDDFEAVGAYHKNIVGWGGEDDYFLSLIESTFGYNVVRALDPGIMHNYHPKDCKVARPSTKEACQNVKVMTEASQNSFGRWYFKANDL